MGRNNRPEEGFVCHHVKVPRLFFVDIWSDVVCPFCYLGSRQFHEALARFEYAEQVVVRHHAFELDRGALREYPGTLNEILDRKSVV